MNILIFIAILIVWTAGRETLLDKYWRYTKNEHLREFGNLYIVLGCLFATFGLAILAR